MELCAAVVATGWLPWLLRRGLGKRYPGREQHGAAADHRHRHHRHRGDQERGQHDGHQRGHPVPG